MYAWHFYVSLKQVGVFYDLLRHMHSIGDSLSVINF